VKFTPRRIREEVNVSRDHPLKEFLILVGGIAGGFLAVFVALGFALDLVVPHIDPGLEKHLGGLYLSAFDAEEPSSPAEARLQELLDDLAAPREGSERDYRVHLIRSEDVNAVALPGGHIMVFSGLVKEAASENELAMVLGHALGHFQDRDHLRGLGRGLVLVFLSSLLFGTDSSLSRLTTALLGSAETQFSQRQENQADAWGLKLIMRRYGHAGGSTAFFRRLAEKKEGKELIYLFASHPFPLERIESLEKAIREEGYPVRETVPLDKSLLETSGSPSGRE
jgi:predicted Zn-dependent protease